jgi:hypothetical protein
MTITLNGTTGITTPGLTNTGTETIVDLTTTGNTTLGDATTDTLTVGVTGIVKDASGNVGIGTSSPVNSGAGIITLTVNGTTQSGAIFQVAGVSTGFIYSNASDSGLGTLTATPYRFLTNSAERMRIDSSGNVGIGTTSVISKLQVVADQASYVNDLAQLTITGTNTNQRLLIGYNTSTDKGFIQATKVGTAYQDLVLQSGGGNVGIGTSSPNAKLDVTTANSDRVIYLKNTNGTPYGVRLIYTGAAPNGAGNEFFYCDDTGGLRFSVKSNGGINNYSANNSNLSDERTKTEIQNAGNYLAKICAIPVRTFKYKDQTDDMLNLGVIAQEVETVAPELVDASGFGEIPEDGIPLKAIYQTDLQYALMKCIQEQQALIQSLTIRLTALETPVPTTPSTGTQA